MRLRGMLLILFASACGDDGGSSSMSDATAGSDASGSDGSMMIDAAPIVGEPPELVGITNAHNAIRAMVQTTPALTPLVWSDSLEATAKAWGMMCINVDQLPDILDHNPNRSQGHEQEFGYVGENIYASGGTATGQAAVAKWAEEKANYHYPDGYNAQTGHYTQMVWRTTRAVGCALVNCPSIGFPSTIICDYGPGGNTGGAPY